MTVPVLRVARPTDDIARLRPFYEAGLGFSELASFEDHNGFDGLILGHPHWPYHLEFTHRHGHPVGRAPTEDNLLVFYLPDQPEWEAAVMRMEAAGFQPVTAYNHYWDANGRTFRGCGWIPDRAAAGSLEPLSEAWWPSLPAARGGRSS